MIYHDAFNRSAGNDITLGCVRTASSGGWSAVSERNLAIACASSLVTVVGCLAFFVQILMFDERHHFGIAMWTFGTMCLGIVVTEAVAGNVGLRFLGLLACAVFCYSMFAFLYARRKAAIRRAYALVSDQAQIYDHVWAKTLEEEGVDVQVLGDAWREAQATTGAGHGGRALTQPSSSLNVLYVRLKTCANAVPVPVLACTGSLSL